MQPRDPHIRTSLLIRSIVRLAHSRAHAASTYAHSSHTFQGVTSMNPKAQAAMAAALQRGTLDVKRLTRLENSLANAVDGLVQDSGTLCLGTTSYHSRLFTPRSLSHLILHTPAHPFLLRFTHPPPQRTPPSYHAIGRVYTSHSSHCHQASART